MNLKILSNSNLINDFNKPLVTNSNSSSNISVIPDINNIQDTSEISYDAKIQYQYIKEFEDSNYNSNYIDPEFIENYALKYASIRSSIMEESSANEADEKINFLDKAYDDAINNAAEKLSRYFQNFFDFSKEEWPDKSTDNKSDFDTKAFKDNILSISDKVMSTVKQAFKDNNFNNLQSNIENKLSSIESGNNLENMNYNDIKEVYNFLSNLPELKHHMKEYFDDGTYRPMSNNWSIEDAAGAINTQHELAEDFLKSGNVSTNTAKNVYNTVLENISAYHKNFAFGFQSDKFQEEINRDEKYYKLLESQYEKYEKRLEDARKQNKMNMILLYLRALGSYKDNLNEIKDKLKNDMDAKEKLSQDHETVVDSDSYKSISSLENFDENKRA